MNFVMLRFFLEKYIYLKKFEAFDIFMGYQVRKGRGPYTQADKTELMTDLLHDRHGLAVYVVKLEILNRGIILLRPGEFELDFFLQELSNIGLDIAGADNQRSSGFEINRDSVQLLLNSMDMEYDKSVLKVALSLGRSRAQIDKLGINADKVIKLSEKIKVVGDEVKNSFTTAEDLIRLHVREQIGQSKDDTEKLKNLLLQKKDDWTKARLGDLANQLDDENQKIKHLSDIIECKDKYHKNLFTDRVKRKAVELIEDNRLKRRKLSNQGRERLIDSDEEKLIEKLTEDKATYHCRRHHVVMYTHKRVKTRDLKDSLDHFRSQKGKPLIRSATTCQGPKI